MSRFAYVVPAVRKCGGHHNDAEPSHRVIFFSFLFLDFGLPWSLRPQCRVLPDGGPVSPRHDPQSRGSKCALICELLICTHKSASVSLRHRIVQLPPSRISVPGSKSSFVRTELSYRPLGSLANGTRSHRSAVSLHARTPAFRRTRESTNAKAHGLESL